MKRFTLVCVLASLMSLASAHAADHVAGKKNCGDEANYPLITTSELKSVVEKKSALIVDVNSDESFAKAHVPGAIHYGKGKDFAKQLPKDKGTMIVSYCGGPKCGAWKKAAEKACEAGYTNVHHYKEGISGWVASK